MQRPGCSATLAGRTGPWPALSRRQLARSSHNAGDYRGLSWHGNVRAGAEAPASRACTGEGCVGGAGGKGLLRALGHSQVLTRLTWRPSRVSLTRTPWKSAKPRAVPGGHPAGSLPQRGPLSGKGGCAGVGGPGRRGLTGKTGARRQMLALFGVWWEGRRMREAGPLAAGPALGVEGSQGSPEITSSRK